MRCEALRPGGYVWTMMVAAGKAAGKAAAVVATEGPRAAAARQVSQRGNGFRIEAQTSGRGGGRGGRHQPQAQRTEPCKKPPTERTPPPLTPPLLMPHPRRLLPEELRWMWASRDAGTIRPWCVCVCVFVCVLQGCMCVCVRVHIYIYIGANTNITISVHIRTRAHTYTKRVGTPWQCDDAKRASAPGAQGVGSFRVRCTGN